jgi:predicted nucleotidyltransferase
VASRIEEIVSLLVESIDPQRVILFGSHAAGTASKGSDIDLAVEGVFVPSIRQERHLKEMIDKVAGLLSVDLIFLDAMRDEEMKRVIKETGVVVYEKE